MKKLPDTSMDDWEITKTKQNIFSSKFSKNYYLDLTIEKENTKKKEEPNTTICPSPFPFKIVLIKANLYKLKATIQYFIF